MLGCFEQSLFPGVSRSALALAPELAVPGPQGCCGALDAHNGEARAGQAASRGARRPAAGADRHHRRPLRRVPGRRDRPGPGHRAVGIPADKSFGEVRIGDRRDDPSYQPELRGYLGQLLADAERFAAAAPQLAEWARAGAAPSPEEIQALRRLILANEQVLAGPGEQDRPRIEEAITTARRSRAALDATFPPQFRGLARQASPTLFPAIERAATAESRHA